MFRFTIRDLLWLTVMVALAVAWWNERRQSLLREVGLAEREADVAQREHEVKLMFRWMAEHNVKIPSSGNEPKTKTLLYYPPDPNDL